MKSSQVIECDQKYFMNVFSGRYPVVVDHGSGMTLYGKDGREYLDFLAGIGVNALGYGHPHLIAALEDQIGKVLHTSNLYYIEPQAELEELLIGNSCCDRVFFSNSGAEANEGAIKLARKYFKVRDSNRYEIVTAENSFHGRTLATLAATGQVKYQQPFRPMPSGFKAVPFNDLEALSAAVGPQTAAVMLEPIQGEGGVIPADPEYLKSVRELCNEQGILLILDEIQCGLGRTGSLFAYQDYEITPDIITLAKALGGGIPIGAFMAEESVANAFQPGDHGSTFGGNHLATRAACATLEVILSEGFLQRVEIMGNYFKGQLLQLEQTLQKVTGVRGRGLMLALMLDQKVSAGDITMALFNRGFLVNPVQEHILRFLPPLIVGEAEIDLLVDALKELLGEGI